MPRRNYGKRPQGKGSGRKSQRKGSNSQPRPLPRDGAAYFGTQIEQGPSWTFGAPYLVRHIGPTAARKFYICPGCNQDIPPGVGHIVAWPEDHADDRRHWHKPCWERR
ncbi:MAG: hypothetical protein Q4A92_03555 [Corynebacterium sp.]|nr:hypothetical protein [Corynebacterium sp.]